MASTERQKFEYENESELVEDYKKIVLASAQSLSYAAEYIFETLVEEAVEGAAFQTHFENKHPEVFAPSTQHHEEPKKSLSLSHNDYSASSKTAFHNCKCLNCEKTVSANKYASHLENCLGIGRTSSRIASRKKTSTFYEEDDDDPESDANWSAKEKPKKKPQGSNGRNGKNKNKNYL